MFPARTLWHRWVGNGCRWSSLLAITAVPASAHSGAGGLVGPWWAQWQPDPLIVSNLVLLGALYALGWRRRHRLPPPPATVRPWQRYAFGVALGLLVLALLSPLDAFADQLLWVHMIQHVVLMNAAAPLFVLGAPARVLWWSLADERRLDWAAVTRRAGRGLPLRYLLWQPVVLWALYAGVLWVWHWPVLYEGALLYPWVHDLQHLMFFAVSVLFWRVLLDPLGRRHLGKMGALLYLFTTSLHAAVLGVFMTLAPRLWYPFYESRARVWGWQPGEDQQLAGYIMWMPGGLAYILVAIVLIGSALARAEPEPGEGARSSVETDQGTCADCP